MNRMMHGALLGLACLLGSAGCTTVTSRPTEPSAPSPRVLATAASAHTSPQPSHAHSTDPAARIVVLWSEAVLREDSRPVTQGFAGKVYLFGSTSNEPTAPPGKMTFYAYDETDQATSDGKTTKVKPDRVWEYDAAQLQQVLRKDMIGSSYSIWLPYCTPTPNERRVTLIVRFTPERGETLLSESTLVTLPAIHGTSSEGLVHNSPATTVVHKPIVQTSFETSSDNRTE